MNLTDIEYKTLKAMGLSPTDHDLTKLDFARSCYEHNIFENLVGFAHVDDDKSEQDMFGIDEEAWRESQMQALEKAMYWFEQANEFEPEDSKFIRSLKFADNDPNNGKAIKIHKWHSVNFYETLCHYINANDIDIISVSDEEFTLASKLMEEHKQNINDQGHYFFWMEGFDGRLSGREAMCHFNERLTDVMDEITSILSEIEDAGGCSVASIGELDRELNKAEAVLYALEEQKVKAKEVCQKIKENQYDNR